MIREVSSDKWINYVRLNKAQLLTLMFSTALITVVAACFSRIVNRHLRILFIST